MDISKVGLRATATSENGYSVTCCERASTWAKGVLMSFICWPIQAFLLVACSLMLIWDVIRHHMAGADMVQPLDDLYVALDYSLCVLLSVEVVLRAVASQGAFFRTWFNYVDMVVLVLLILTNIVMHTRFDKILGRKRANRNLWVIVVYAIRYVSQVIRMVMVWNEGRATALMLKNANECQVQMPDFKCRYRDLEEIDEEADYSKNGKEDHNGFHASETTKIFKFNSNSSINKYGTYDETHGRPLKPNSYERNLRSAEQMAVAFDINVTPLGSPRSDDDWVDALTPAHNGNSLHHEIGEA
ncbi:hypothetical protein AAMO2058_000990400 [Amorphochlora amoebiformis]